MVTELITLVLTCFSNISDHRSANRTYALCDVLMSAFAIFHLKDDSILEFRKELPAREQNLKTVYGLYAIPKDTALRQSLDGVNQSC